MTCGPRRASSPFTSTDRFIAMTNHDALLHPSTLSAHRARGSFRLPVAVLDVLMTSSQIKPSCGPQPLAHRSVTSPLAKLPRRTDKAGTHPGSQPLLSPPGTKPSSISMPQPGALHRLLDGHGPMGLEPRGELLPHPGAVGAAAEVDAASMPRASRATRGPRCRSS